MSDRRYRPAWWVPGPHAQTLWGRLSRRRLRRPLRTEQWDTPDGDVVELLRLDAPARAAAPRLVLLHGLEGGPQSHYTAGLVDEAHARGWHADLLLFRGCGAAPNRARRFYHSGETDDLALVVDRLRREHPDQPLLLAGVSLGGNVLLKYLGERGADAPAAVRAAAVVSVPFDLGRGSRHLSRGFSHVYERHFLRSLRRKALAKLARYPDLFDAERLAVARTLFDFDDVVTAPVHGFASADDYYDRSSALRFLGGVRRPTLLLSAADDPFLPAGVLDDVRAVAADNPCLDLEFVARGGHVGFVSGVRPWKPFYYAEWRVADYLASRLAASMHDATHDATHTAVVPDATRTATHTAVASDA